MSLRDIAENEKNTVMVLKTGDHNETDVMREVLTSIAVEIQSFHDFTFESESDVVIPGYQEKQNVFSELLKCKSKIKSKRDRIQRLRNNLKTACSVAKIVAASKETESESLKKSLDIAREECKDMLEKHRINTETIHNVTRENENLHNKYNNVANFIRLGYEELKKIREEPLEEIAALEQLRQLIICCGQYYADYCNEHDECLQLRHRNSFLTNKILILENNIGALSQQLKALNYRNFRLQKQNEKFKSFNRNDIDVVFSDVTFTKSSDSESSSDDDKSTRKIESSDPLYQQDTDKGLDLSPHLSMIKKLLECQDVLLKDLKSISEEFSVNKSVDELST